MNVEALLGQVITGFEQEAAPDVPQEEVHDVTDSSYYTLTTKKGSCNINLRVNHNGYYGGWLNGPFVVDGWEPVEGNHRQITVDSPFRANEEK